MILYGYKTLYLIVVTLLIAITHFTSVSPASDSAWECWYMRIGEILDSFTYLTY